MINKEQIQELLNQFNEINLFDVGHPLHGWLIPILIGIGVFISLWLLLLIISLRIIYLIVYH